MPGTPVFPSTSVPEASSTSQSSKKPSPALMGSEKPAASTGTGQGQAPGAMDQWFKPWEIIMDTSIIWEDHGNIYWIKIYIQWIYVIIYCICCRNSVHPLFVFPYIFNLSEKNSMEIKSNDLFTLCIYLEL